MVDPEAAWQFLKRRIFDVEGIELIQRPFSTFKDTVDSLHEPEKLGACCWIVDPLTLIWNELLDSFKQKLGYISIDNLPSSKPVSRLILLGVCRIRSGRVPSA